MTRFSLLLLAVAVLWLMQSVVVLARAYAVRGRLTAAVQGAHAPRDALYDRALARFGALVLKYCRFLPSLERLAEDAGLGARGAMARFVVLLGVAALAAAGLAAGLVLSAGRSGWLPVSMAVLGGGLVCAGGIPYLRWRRGARQERIRHEMPFCLDIMTVMMKGGNNVEQCFRQLLASGAQACPETHQAVMHLIADLDNGKPYAAAFDRWADMLMLPTARTLAGLFQQSILHGTEITPSLIRLSAMLIDERLQQARLAAGRRLPQITIVMLLFLLPPMFVILTAPAVTQLVRQMGNMK